MLLVFVYRSRYKRGNAILFPNNPMDSRPGLGTRRSGWGLRTSLESRRIFVKSRVYTVITLRATHYKWRNYTGGNYVGVLCIIHRTPKP